MYFGKYKNLFLIFIKNISFRCSITNHCTTTFKKKTYLIQTNYVNPHIHSSQSHKQCVNTDLRSSICNTCNNIHVGALRFLHNQWTLIYLKKPFHCTFVTRDWTTEVRVGFVTFKCLMSITFFAQTCRFLTHINNAMDRLLFVNKLATIKSQQSSNKQID